MTNDRQIRVSVGGYSVTIDPPTGSWEGSPSLLPIPAWLPFSHTEQRVLVLLLSEGAKSREQIALALDESIDGRLRGILAGLHARRVLHIGDDGYAINAPESTRPALRRWLDTVAGEPGLNGEKP